MRFNSLMVASLFLALMGMSSAKASSDAAWQQHDKQAKQACKSASSLKNIVWLSQPVLFDDTVGYTALKLKGKFKPARSQKTWTQEELCLYSRKSGKAYIAEVTAVK